MRAETRAPEPPAAPKAPRSIAGGEAPGVHPRHIGPAGAEEQHNRERVRWAMRFDELFDAQGPRPFQGRRRVGNVTGGSAPGY